MDNFALQVLCVLVLSAATFAVALLRRRPLSPSPSPSLPPSPPGLPIIGHLHLLRGMPHHTLAKLARKLGPIIHLRLGQVNTVAISSSDLAELVLKTHDPIFSSRPQIVGAQYLSFGCSDVTFSPYGPYWRQARKICVTELLSSKRVGSFQFIRSEEVTRMLSTISGQAGLEIDLSELFFNLANDVLCRVAFGRRFIEGSEERKGRDLAGVLKETQELLAGFCVGEFFPEWRWVNCLSGMRRRLEKNLGNLRDVCDEIIREHLERREKSGEEREDFVDVLLRVQKRVDLEVPITDDNLKALVLDMFVAGTDTTSSTLEWTMTQLARHPTVLKKAQEEVRRTSATKGMVEEGDLHHLRYLKAVIQETMRLNPPVPLLVPRESMEDCILKGYKIPAKTRVLINTYAIGRDPESWRDPLEFNPERFMEEEIDFKGQDYRFLPFGGGRRGCPGFAFGLATVQITLARLLFHFEWALPHGLKADNLDMEEIFGLATRKKTALVLVPSISSDGGFKGK